MEPRIGAGDSACSLKLTPREQNRRNRWAGLGDYSSLASRLGAGRVFQLSRRLVGYVTTVPVSDDQYKINIVWLRLYAALLYQRSFGWPGIVNNLGRRSAR